MSKKDYPQVRIYKGFLIEVDVSSIVYCRVGDNWEYFFESLNDYAEIEIDKIVAGQEFMSQAALDEVLDCLKQDREKAELIRKLEAIERKIKLMYYVDAEHMIDEMLYQMGRVREVKDGKD